MKEPKIEYRVQLRGLVNDYVGNWADVPERPCRTIEEAIAQKQEWLGDIYEPERYAPTGAAAKEMRDLMKDFERRGATLQSRIIKITTEVIDDAEEVQLPKPLEASVQ